MAAVANVTVPIAIVRNWALFVVDLPKDPEFHAEVVRQLRAAGAVQLGPDEAAQLMSIGNAALEQKLAEVTAERNAALSTLAEYDDAIAQANSDTVLANLGKRLKKT